MAETRKTARPKTIRPVLDEAETVMILDGLEELHAQVTDIDKMHEITALMARIITAGRPFGLDRRR